MNLQETGALRDLVSHLDGSCVQDDPAILILPAITFLAGRSPNTAARWSIDFDTLADTLLVVARRHSDIGWDDYPEEPERPVQNIHVEDGLL